MSYLWGSWIWGVNTTCEMWVTSHSSGTGCSCLTQCMIQNHKHWHFLCIIYWTKYGSSGVSGWTTHSHNSPAHILWLWDAIPFLKQHLLDLLANVVVLVTQNVSLLFSFVQTNKDIKLLPAWQFQLWLQSSSEASSKVLLTCHVTAYSASLISDGPWRSEFQVRERVCAPSFQLMVPLGLLLISMASFTQRFHLLVSDVMILFLSQSMMWVFLLQWSVMADFRFSCSVFCCHPYFSRHWCCAVLHLFLVWIIKLVGLWNAGVLDKDMTC